MKQFAVLTAVALSAAFIPFKAPAIDMMLNISGTIKSESTNVVYSTNTVFTTNAVPIKQGVVSMSLNNKSVYNLISNAVAGAYGTLGANITPVTLPADGYIAFDPNVVEDQVVSNNLYADGLFYVTNKSGFYYALSGFDNADKFFSFIEFDSYVIYSSSIDGFQLGFGSLSTDVVTYNLNNKTADGSGTGISTGTLYIHDNPYVLDDLDNPNRFFTGFTGLANKNAIEIRGIVTTQIHYTNAAPAYISFSLTGTGNSVIHSRMFLSVVSSGNAKLSP